MLVWILTLPINKRSECGNRNHPEQCHTLETWIKRPLSMNISAEGGSRTLCGTDSQCAHQNGFPTCLNLLFSWLWPDYWILRQEGEWNWCMLSVWNRCIFPTLFPSLPADWRVVLRGPRRWSILKMKEPISLNHYVESCLLKTHFGPEARNKFHLWKTIEI